MSSKKCSTCYFGDKCHSFQICDGYYPITEEAEEECAREDAQKDYEAFCEEWNQYIQECCE